MHDFGAPLALPWRHNPNYLDGKEKGVGVPISCEKLIYKNIVINFMR